MSSWASGDAVSSWNYDFLADGSKIRRAGFTTQVHTATTFDELSTRLRRERIVP